MSKILDWGMTPGMGDVMLALNSAHHWSYENQEALTLNLHWFHSKDHLHHPEDPETIVERADYILSLYLKSNIEVNHVFNSDNKELTQTYSRYSWLNPRKGNGTNNWIFDPKVHLPTDKNKIVIWRPTFNAELPRYWKRIITHEKWELVINHFKDLGYNVVELCYRTPIREATYHINTCDFVICYDGMWHYVAKNFYKPMIIASFEPITRWHTRNALPIDDIKFTKWVTNLHNPIYYPPRKREVILYDLIQNRASRHKELFWEWYNGN